MVVRALPQARIHHSPDFTKTLGRDAAEIVARSGQPLDEWQIDHLERAMAVDADGRWLSFEAGLNVPRQNGKGSVGEARVLWQARLPKQQILWSAQQQETSNEAQRRLVDLVEENAELKALNPKVVWANGKEAIEFRANGSRIRFMTRSKARARGFSGQFVLFDEAMFLAEYSVAAMLPILSAQPNPQVWYMGSAVDQQIHEHGIVWSRVRERGIEGAPRLVYTEFSVDADGPLELSREQLEDPELWAQANPALDVRISRDYVESEVLALDARSFAVERLGVGDWPRTDFVSSSPITPEAWAALTDTTSVLEDPVYLGYDLSADRKGAIAAAGRNQRGELHVEIVDHRQGSSWIIPRLLELEAKHDVAGFIRDGYGPVASLAQREEDEDMKVRTTSAGEHGAACGMLVDLVAEQQIRHLGSNELTDAVRGASTRPLGDAWAWSRKNSGVDISPLVAATLALSAAAADPGSELVIY